MTTMHHYTIYLSRQHFIDSFWGKWGAGEEGGEGMGKELQVRKLKELGEEGSWCWEEKVACLGTNLAYSLQI